MLPISLPVPGYNLLRGFGASDNVYDFSRAPVIGEIQSVEGDVEYRYPRSIKQTKVTGPRALHNQAMTVTTITEAVA